MHDLDIGHQVSWTVDRDFVYPYGQGRFIPKGTVCYGVAVQPPHEFDDHYWVQEGTPAGTWCGFTFRIHRTSLQVGEWRRVWVSLESG